MVGFQIVNLLFLLDRDLHPLTPSFFLTLHWLWFLLQQHHTAQYPWFLPHLCTFYSTYCGWFHRYHSPTSLSVKTSQVIICQCFFRMKDPVSAFKALYSSIYFSLPLCCLFFSVHFASSLGRNRIDSSLHTQSILVDNTECTPEE